jgi:hypothetical protein
MCDLITCFLYMNCDLICLCLVFVFPEDSWFMFSFTRLVSKKLARIKEVATGWNHLAVGAFDFFK